MADTHGRGEFPGIGPARPHEAPRLLRLIRACDAQTRFLIHTAGERQVTSPGLAAMISDMRANETGLVLLARQKSVCVGYVLVVRGVVKATRHLARITALGVDSGHWRRGIGRALMHQVLDWALDTGLSRLELEVMSSNPAALALYAGLGFEREGARRRAYVIDNQWVDAVAMARLL
jgi:RimJ/RimL family protein N-acetyltransferase